MSPVFTVVLPGLVALNVVMALLTIANPETAASVFARRVYAILKIAKVA
jgi:hypothetical protein